MTEIPVSGGKLFGKAEYDSKSVLNELTQHAEERFGFASVTLSLHFHTRLGDVGVNV